MARIRIEPPPPSSSEYQWGGTLEQDPATRHRQLLDQLLETAQMGYTHKIESIMKQIDQIVQTVHDPRIRIEDPVAFLVANHKTKRGPLRKLAELGYATHEALIPALTAPDALELVSFLVDELGADPAQVKSRFSLGTTILEGSDPCFGPFWDALALLVSRGYVYRVSDDEKDWLEDKMLKRRKSSPYYFDPPVKYLLYTLAVNFSVATAIAEHPEGWDHNILRFLVKTKHALTHDQRDKIAAELVAREMGC